MDRGRLQALNRSGVVTLATLIAFAACDRQSRLDAELPASAQLPHPAAFITGPGQTMDFEYRPTAPGLMRLEVEQRTGSWKTHLPIRIER